MQATMWLVLGAAVGLAALVNHERRRSMRVELGSPASHGWLVVRLPKTWQQSASAEREDRIVARAIEPDEQGLGRTVTITRDRVTRPISPLEFLLTSNAQMLGLDLLLAQDPQGGKDLIESITVGGQPGILVRGVRTPGRHGSGALPHKEIYGVTIVPSGHAIVVKLEGDRPAELSDVEIVKQLAGAIEISGQPALGQSGETVALDGGIRLNAPDGFRPVYENDANLLRRRLWPDGDAMRWTAAELIPCLLAPAENHDETMAIKALAAVHDPELRDAVVAPDGPRRWRITRSTTDTPFTTRGYLVADELGDAGAITGVSPRRALMAFFYGGTSGDTGDAAATDAAWDALARSASFVGKTNFGALLDAGKDEVARIRKESLPKLLGTSGTQWWLWFDEGERRNVGWTMDGWTLNRVNDPLSPKASAGESRTILHHFAGGREETFTTWDGELRTYNSRTLVTLSLPAAAAEPVRRLASVAGDKMVISTSSRGQKLAEGSGPMPPEFISGAWLPLLIGKLSHDAMILKVESYPVRERVGAPVPMTLIIQRVTEQPAPAEPDGTPLRVLSVQINGASEASRWYIRPNGEVRRVTFARGLYRHPSDEQTVEFTFPADFQR
ncbi:MAG: hypothetical protein M3478_12870 [Planctomycetota bacterium]|nr:hypothetical protein [Planctomycetota bacterium]